MIGKPRTTCARARRLLHERLGGSLGPVTERSLGAHLAACPGCAAEEERLSTALAALRALPAPEMPARLAPRLRAALARAAAETSRRRVRRWAPALATALVAAAVWTLVLRTPTLVPPSGLVARLPIVTGPGATPVIPPAPLSASVPVLGAEGPSQGTERSAGQRRRGPRRVASERSAPPSTPQAVRASAADFAEATPPRAGALEPGEIRLASAPRMATVPGAASAAERAGGDFSNQVVGGLIANVLLTSYLEGAPRGARPAEGAAGWQP